MTEPVAAHDFRLVRGGLYRNPLGAELRVVAPVREFAARNRLRWGPVVFGHTTFGDIWVVESSHELFGITRHLATGEGLLSCGYCLVSAPTESETNE
ncbi:hypothetical protein NDR87_31635 [Nocardia sp. CDC159]|uniref:Uncharacterized protein n=1 Tax=Nocardia pulmonis TaxID=2951408 RepID=A0A9X2EBP2_9NOCA|nr:MULTISPECIES: hypothetical protein [Nocardia]MCM6777897.1 hypothetical protein [Nocardia pulmonis]MCM6790932.1 hypothetical protein [Nocardia sp. CDC159]